MVGFIGVCLSFGFIITLIFLLNAAAALCYLFDWLNLIDWLGFLNFLLVHMFLQFYLDFFARWRRSAWKRRDQKIQVQVWNHLFESHSPRTQLYTTSRNIHTIWRGGQHLSGTGQVCQWTCGKERQAVQMLCRRICWIQKEKSCQNGCWTAQRTTDREI